MGFFLVEIILVQKQYFIRHKVLSETEFSPIKYADRNTPPPPKKKEL